MRKPLSGLSRSAMALFAAALTGCGGQDAAPKKPTLPPTPAEHAEGEAVYQSGCGSCHDSSRDGAPRLGYLAAWEKRLPAGQDALFQSVAEGKGLMPPRGDLPDLTDEQLRKAVAYMAYRAELNIPAGH